MAAFEALTALYTKATSRDVGRARAAAAELASGVEAAGVASIMSMALPAKVMASLGEAKNVAAREGAVLVCHALHTKLGLHFEPYMLLVLPALIERFDDKVKTVANAVDACLSAFVQAVNPYAAATLLPFLLAGVTRSLEDQVGCLATRHARPHGADADRQAPPGGRPQGHREHVGHEAEVKQAAKACLGVLQSSQS